MNHPELRLLHRWLDTWPGIGNVVAGMARAEYDLELRRYDGQGWRDLFSEWLRAPVDVACGCRVGEEPVGGRAARRRGCLAQT
jgi:hypothetical protein